MGSKSVSRARLEFFCGGAPGANAMVYAAIEAEVYEEELRRLGGNTHFAAIKAAERHPDRVQILYKRLASKLTSGELRKVFERIDAQKRGYDQRIAKESA